jgi:hypothetical protein
MVASGQRLKRGIGLTVPVKYVEGVDGHVGRGVAMVEGRIRGWREFGPVRNLAVDGLSGLDFDAPEFPQVGRFGAGDIEGCRSRQHGIYGGMVVRLFLEIDG